MNDNKLNKIIAACGNDCAVECFEVTMSFEPFCKQVCTNEEYETMRKAFF